ncbi:hypothetical protein [Thermoflexus sp.]|uniref:hypothetical protein n=1 Tax=Thermoflexus sp. TaxID=1969742 RepID=UPI0025E9FE70|nr:hypothetical protein [Thermoflexus sp.]MCS7351615.1 hypothetical protein [Thermoflexus sp.]MCX7690877.1 hypothetical protein [Thermoflexus sp.]MDW8181073.1 hypothetical protein [Anaerolineae bacterium]
MSGALRINPDEVRERIQRLRRWREGWAERLEAARRTSRMLAEAVRAVPGQRWEMEAGRHAVGLAKAGERAEGLAQVLESALARLEAAFQEAAALLREPIPRPIVTTTPLAVDAHQRPLANQFSIDFPTPSGPVPWSTACGPVALSMVLSRIQGRLIPAQEVANKLVEVTGKTPRLNPKGHVNILTTHQDLLRTARAYEGVQAERLTMHFKAGRDPSEQAWEHLREATSRPGGVIALVTAKRSTSELTRKAESWVFNGLLAEEVIGDPAQRREGDGGLLTGTRHAGENGIAHWVVVDHVEAVGNQRYVVINNPFHNRSERYPWEYFWRSLNHQAVGPDSWWFLRFYPSASSERPGVRRQGSE